MGITIINARSRGDAQPFFTLGQGMKIRFLGGVTGENIRRKASGMGEKACAEDGIGRVVQLIAMAVARDLA